MKDQLFVGSPNFDEKSEFANSKWKFNVTFSLGRGQCEVDMINVDMPANNVCNVLWK